MIRPLTFLCMLMAASSGLYLYQVKNRTRLLDRQIAQVMKTADTTRARTGVLQAEWALQNDPERLQDLADRFLALRPVSPGQFIAMAELDHRIPPVDTPPSPAASDPDPQIEPPAALDVRPDTTEPVRQVSDTIPRHNPDPPARPVADTASKVPPAASVVIASRPTPTPMPPVTSAAPPASLPTPPTAFRPPAPPRAVAAAATHTPSTRYDAAQPGNTAQEVINRIIRNTRPEPSVPAVASVLGAARTNLAPPIPVPVATAEAASYVAPR